jgi:hypothetical protein
MEAINGKVKRAVHKVEKPNCAPACEYVAIPDGSSSLAPVMRPGPNERRNASSFEGDFFRY